VDRLRDRERKEGLHRRLHGDHVRDAPRRHADRFPAVGAGLLRAAASVSVAPCGVGGPAGSGTGVVAGALPRGARQARGAVTRAGAPGGGMSRAEGE
jgi:hypothetical protein